MRVLKVLNNNYLLVEDDRGNEQIVMGKGLRFSNQVGEELKKDNVQKIFSLRDKKTVHDWEQILENVPENQEKRSILQSPWQTKRCREN